MADKVMTQEEMARKFLEGQARRQASSKRSRAKHVEAGDIRYSVYVPSGLYARFAQYCAEGLADMKRDLAKGKIKADPYVKPRDRYAADGGPVQDHGERQDDRRDHDGEHHG